MNLFTDIMGNQGFVLVIYLNHEIDRKLQSSLALRSVAQGYFLLFSNPLFFFHLRCAFSFFVPLNASLIPLGPMQLLAKVPWASEKMWKDISNLVGPELCTAVISVGHLP